MKMLPRKTTAIAAVLALGAALIAVPVLAHGPGGPGGYGMMGGGQMGPGMWGQMGSGMRGQMGPGMMGSMGPGMMGYGPGAQGDCPYAKVAYTDKKMTTADVTKFLEDRISHMGNKRLKVGEVTTKDDGAIIADIVTVDDSLVQRLEFDPKTGRHHPIK